LAVYFEKREIVVPGQLLAEGRYRASVGTYMEGENVYSTIMGLAELRGNTVRVVPLQGVYIPREGDLVLGTITYVAGNNWKVDIGGPYQASIHANNALRRPYDDDISKYMDVGDVIAAEVSAFDRVTGPYLTMKGRGLRKLEGGMVVRVSPAKIPRIIGRKGSMIKMIMDALKIKVMVGQNGRIWVDAPTIDVMRLARKAFRMIEDQSHTSNLTNRVEEMLKEEMAKLEEAEESDEADEEESTEDSEELDEEEDIEEEDIEEEEVNEE
jgi:exosome complex component RRP4